MRHLHHKTGQPCNCTFGPKMVMAKTAAKLDWLRSRPDLQTPEGHGWLDYLERLHPHADPLYPFLTKEWKKGRLFAHNNDVAERGPDGQLRPQRIQDIRGEPQEPLPGGQVDPPITRFKIPQFENPEAVGGHEPLVPGLTRHWMDWYNSTHPTRQGVDIGAKAFQMPHMLERVKSWEDAMKAEAEKAKVQQQADAPVLHEWPDGWKLQRLLPEHLDYEGDTMGHCVGGFGYENQVRDGMTSILSLRDPTGRPHVTAELTPDHSTYGEDDHEWPVVPEFNIDRAIAQHAVTRATPEYIKEGLRGVHDEVGHLDPFDREERLKTVYPLPSSGADLGALYKVLRSKHKGTVMPPLDKAEIVQIQGKGNEIPKPEYQARMKDWFQTFPEHQRPQWHNQTSSPIEHIGALDPDVVSMKEPSFARYPREVYGEPNEYGEDDEGGYGAHGDYGLAGSHRPINYFETMNSLVRPQDHQDYEYNWKTYNPSEAKTLYQEALRRGEIDKMGEAHKRFDEHAMEEYDKADQHEMDYNPEHPGYPGESWDEDEQRWLEGTDEWGEPFTRSEEEAQEAWQEAHKQYDEVQKQIAENHPWHKASNDLYNWLEPHMQTGQDENGYSTHSYTNPETPPGVPPEQHWTNKDVRGQAMGHGLNEQQLDVSKLPGGARFMDQWGHEQHIYENPPGSGKTWDSSGGKVAPYWVPKYVKLPGQPTNNTTFSRVARGPHAHITTGQPCTCPWGARLAKTAAKIDWLKERGDKFSQTPHGQIALRALEKAVEYNPKIDPLTPWLFREIKKGRADISSDGRGVFDLSMNEGEYEPIDHWADWFGSNSATRRGVDIMQLSLPDMRDRIAQWDAELAAKMDEERQNNNGEVVHQFDDGWSVRRVNGGEARDEGDAMGHCVGSYANDIDNGNIGIFSLRDHKNQPHATVEVRPQYWEHPQTGEPTMDRHSPGTGFGNYVQHKPLPHGGAVHQIQGKENSPPRDEYRSRLAEWFGSLSPSASVDSPKTQVPAPTDLGTYLNWYQPESDEMYDRYRLHPSEAWDYGLEGDDDPFEYDQGEWDHNGIVNDLFHEYNTRYNCHREVFQAADEMGDDKIRNELMKRHPGHLQEFWNEVYDPKQYSGAAPVQWNQWGPGKVYNDAFNQNMLTRDAQGNVLGTPQPTQLHPEQQKLFSKVATTKPLYYRWVFSPVTGEVELAHNNEPDVRYHGDIAGELNEPGLIHGYAYRIGGGWRLTDWENRAVEDPYVIAQVMRKLRGEDQQTPAKDGEWEPVNDDFERTHHGLPLPAETI